MKQTILRMQKLRCSWTCPLNPNVGGPGLPGNAVEEQQLQREQQNSGLSTLGFKTTCI